VPISNRPWGEVSEADYDVGQWHRACLIHTHDGEPESKAECKLPVREPSGTLNRNGVHAAAAALAGARGGVSAPADAKRNAARRLRSLYRELEEDPPESVVRMAAG
jgi:hypothetical protein